MTKNNVIEIHEKFQIPGTDIILEKGDKIGVLQERGQRFKLESRSGNVYGEFTLNGDETETLEGSIFIDEVRTGGMLEPRRELQDILEMVDSAISVD